jgi:hypothetical protein
MMAMIRDKALVYPVIAVNDALISGMMSGAINIFCRKKLLSAQSMMVRQSFCRESKRSRVESTRDSND